MIFLQAQSGCTWATLALLKATIETTNAANANTEKIINGINTIIRIFRFLS